MIEKQDIVELRVRLKIDSRKCKKCYSYGPNSAAPPPVPTRVIPASNIDVAMYRDVPLYRQV